MNWFALHPHKQLSGKLCWRIWHKQSGLILQLAKDPHNHTRCLCQAIGTFLGTPYTCTWAQWFGGLWAYFQQGSQGGIGTCYRDTFDTEDNISRIYLAFQINNVKIVTRKSEDSPGCESYDVLRYRPFIYVWKNMLQWQNKIFLGVLMGYRVTARKIFCQKCQSFQTFRYMKPPVNFFHGCFACLILTP